MKIIVSNRSQVPIYEQIKNQIKEAILNNELKEDEMLPSIRQLAKDLKISVITTTRAYNDLADEGYVTNVQGKGCFVLPQNTELARENALYKIEEALGSILLIAKNSNISKSEVLEILDVLAKEEDYD